MCYLDCKGKGKRSIAVHNTPHHCGNSQAIWDQTNWWKKVFYYVFLKTYWSALICRKLCTRGRSELLLCVGRQRKWFTLAEARQQLFRHRPTMCDYLDLLQKPVPVKPASVSVDQPLEPLSSTMPPTRTTSPSWRPGCYISCLAALPSHPHSTLVIVCRGFNFCVSSVAMHYSVCIIGA